MGYKINNGFKLKTIDLTDDTQVNSGGSTNTQTLKPSAGKIYQVIHIRLNTPAIGGASGDHKTAFQYTDGTTYMDLAYLKGTDGATYEIDGRNGFIASTELPSNAQQQYEFMHNSIIVSNSHYVEIKYTNDSDTNQTGTRTLVFWVKESNEMT